MRNALESKSARLQGVIILVKKRQKYPSNIILFISATQSSADGDLDYNNKP